MGSKYLKRSSMGWYSYRRRVPSRLKNVIGKSEFKESFATKDEALALWKLGIFNQEVEKQLATAEKQAALGRDLTPAEVREVASRYLKRLGLHPDQQPSLTASATAEERSRFTDQRIDWKDRYDRFLSDFYVSQEVGTDAKTWRTIYKPADATDVFQTAYLIASGEVEAPVKPTWASACNDYLEVNRQEKRRNPYKQRIFETKVRALYQKFASFLGGKDTPLEDISRQQARAYLDTYRQGSEPASEATIGRYSSQFGAVFNFARQEYQNETIKNPFEGLRNMSRERDTAKDRRSFTPSELAAYEKALVEKFAGGSPIGLIGLVMLYTGCATSEAAGLEVGDIRLECEAPHLRMRANSHRRLDKGRVERSVPVAAPLLKHLKALKLANHADEGAFGKYSDASSYSNVSVQLNNIIRNKLKIPDPSLTAYSTRHTFKDRGRVARVAPDVVDYLQGHVTKASSAIAQRYGTGVPPSMYVEDLNKILATKAWGDN
ncbi:hypothetical protein DSM14862_02429 [Sulfitobacter indolifex]|uniref:Phage integrase n=1 Tax=Sulfitobacter indolifex HEL-45 TaxID=391624 RepID=A0ABM9X7R0_9RHOB|nr:DUF6538 domain-containing protein [Sulfitobacter indolifex]EDQ05444.1 phage integrase [Sulfitobacter indolifex HEL-45]UOA19621.1 hypothetical protein DSM14862_02429 [Sulfitobacter indolifex]